MDEYEALLLRILEWDESEHVYGETYWSWTIREALGMPTGPEHHGYQCDGDQERG